MRITQTALSAVAVALVYMATPAIAQTANVAETAATDVDQNAEINAFFEEYDAQQLARSPLGKSYRGIKDSDYGKWDDGSDEAEARYYDAERSALKEMRARFNPAKLNSENQLSFRLFEKRAARRGGL